MINLSSAELCALEHVLEHALVAKKWVTNTTGNSGLWVQAHTDIHKRLASGIQDKIAKAQQ